VTTTVATTTAVTEVATTSAAHESPGPQGRPGNGAAAARTAQLYTLYGRTVSGLCGALLRSRIEAEDATQQTFLSAHRALLAGTKPREPAAWLATIARNECLGRIRARMREPLPTDQTDVASTAADPLAEAIRRADLAALWQAIEALPLQQRDAILLREFGGLSYDELAVALAVSGSAVESLLFRARRRLRAQLRTAYASLTGAAWIEAVARVFAGGSAPVAAKVAALGVGAAAVSGGAVVAPQLLENHHPRSPAPVRSAPPGAHQVPVVAPVAERHVVVRARSVATVPAAPERRDERREGRDEPGRSGPSRAGGTEVTRSGDDEAPLPATVAPAGSGEGLSGSSDGHSGPGDISSGSGSGSSGSGSGSSGSGTGSSGSGDGGESGSGDGGGSHDGGGESS
jgi:RNA polymerase sigma factor (sigma-70 family)